MMKAYIRQVEKKDNTALAQVIRQVFEEHNAPKIGTVYSDPTTDYLYELFKHPASILWVAEYNNEIMGCCGVFPTEGLPEGCAELVKFYLAKNARGQGIGKQLMEKCNASAKELGYKTLYLESHPVYAKAVDIYLKQGYKHLEKPMGNSGHCSCNIWMIKELT